jgi:hypothetical protein
VRPPYSSGAVIPWSPSAPIFGQRSRGKRLSRSIAAARGAISFSQKVLALSRIISALSPRSKSNGLGALAIMGAGPGANAPANLVAFGGNHSLFVEVLDGCVDGLSSASTSEKIRVARLCALSSPV